MISAISALLFGIYWGTIIGCLIAAVYFALIGGIALWALISKLVDFFCVNR